MENQSWPARTGTMATFTDCKGGSLPLWRSVVLGEVYPLPLLSFKFLREFHDQLHVHWFTPLSLKSSVNTKAICCQLGNNFCLKAGASSRTLWLVLGSFSQTFPTQVNSYTIQGNTTPVWNSNNLCNTSKHARHTLIRQRVNFWTLGRSWTFNLQTHET